MSRRLEDLVEIANPQQPHCPAVLLLDISGSMAGEPITALNEAVKFFKQDVENDDLASKRIDLAIVTFGGTSQVAQDFTSIKDFESSAFTAGGGTPMGKAIGKALDMVKQRKRQYKQLGIDYFRPWVFMITDGEPTDMEPGDLTWNEVVNMVHEGEANKEFLFFAVGVQKANMEILKQIAPPNREPLPLKGLEFAALFEWLSKSLREVSSSSPGEQVRPKSPSEAGWVKFDA